MPLTIDGQANSITSSVGGVNIPATVGTLSVGPSGSYMNVTSSGIAATSISATNITTTQVLNNSGRPILNSTGSILQVVQTVKSDVFGTSSTSYTDVTGFNATITPSSTSSKILVFVTGVAGMSGAVSGFMQLLRGSTPICVGNTLAGYTSSSGPNFYGGSSDGNNNETFAIHFLDSPATTSATTYKLQVYAPQAGNIYINSLGSFISGQVYSSVTASTITLMEVSG